MTDADLARAVFASVILLGCVLYVWWSLLPKEPRVPDVFPVEWTGAARPFDFDTDWEWEDVA